MASSQVCCDQQEPGHELDRLPSRDDLEAMAATFKALGDPTRAHIVAALSQRALCVGELSELLDLSVSAISHQLALLRNLRIIRSHREGRRIVNALDDEHILAIYHYGLDHVQHRRLRAGTDG